MIYPNYPQVGNQYTGYQYTPQMNSPYNMQPAVQQQQVQQIGLNGKIVDSIDVARATDVPMGGYGIFPKADLTEIYVKQWNPNGTTSLLAFKPVIEQPKIEPTNDKAIAEILQKIGVLETKLDNVLSNPAPVEKRGTAK